MWAAVKCLLGAIIIFSGVSSTSTAETVRVGIYENKPKVFTDENGKARGIFIEVLEDIAAKEGWRLEYVAGTWPEGLRRLEEGRIDLMPDVAYSEKRAAMYEFGKVPVLSDWFQVYCREDRDYRSILDLSGKKVAVLKGSIQQDVFTGMVHSFELECELVPVEDYGSALVLVDKGEVDAVILNRFYGREHAGEHHTKETNIIFNPTLLYFAATKGKRGHLEVIDGQLTAMKANEVSAYYEILGRWLETGTRIVYPKYLKHIFVSVAALLVLALAGNLVLRWQVKKRTVHLIEVQKALSDNEKRYRTLFEHSPVGILVADIKTREFLYANPAVCKMFGREEHELLHLGIADIHPRDSLNSVVTEFEAQARGEKVLAASLPCVRKDGAVFYADITTAPTVVDGRECNVGFFMDITEHKQAELALRESEERYRNLVENTDDLVQSVAPDGAILYVNRAWRDTLGYSEEEVRKLSIFDIIHPESLAHCKDVFRRVCSGEKVELVEAKFVTKAGKAIIVEGSTNCYFVGGRPVTAYGIFHDFTERRHLEEQFRQAQKMEAVGQLAGGVAHDFNNLLTIITGYCEIILGSTDEQSPFWKKITAIAQAGERAAQLTRQLLTFSRKQILKPKVISLNAVVNESKKLLGRLIGENIELRTVLEPDLKPVLADPGQVEQVIMNLAVNARDAMPDGGDLSITTANVELSQEYAHEHPEVEPGPYVMLTVSDTGTGMTEEVKRHLFEPFFTTKEQGKGTGLGLSTVYGIVKQSNGHVNVYTELGHGTTFKVYFPVMLDMKESAQAEKQKVAKPRKGSETILVVEDESGVREFMIDVLRGAGYMVLAAENGEKAEKACAGHQGRIHMLLVDMVLPRISGRELANKLTSNCPGAKVLFMSGYTDDVVFRSGGLDPGAAFLEKPFTPDVLLHKVREVLGGSA